jgi:hypothetical protein
MFSIAPEIDIGNIMTIKQSANLSGILCRRVEVKIAVMSTHSSRAFDKICWP